MVSNGPKRGQPPEVHCPFSSQKSVGTCRRDKTFIKHDAELRTVSNEASQALGISLKGLTLPVSQDPMVDFSIFLLATVGAAPLLMLWPEYSLGS